MSVFSYSKSEKLKSRKDIKTIFSHRFGVSKYPLRLAYFLQPSDTLLLNVGVSVSKKHFKHAVDRNRIKRLLREAYRLNKHLLLADSPNFEGQLMLLYQDREMPNAAFINQKMIELFEKFNKQVKDSES